MSVKAPDLARRRQILKTACALPGLAFAQSLLALEKRQQAGALSQLSQAEKLIPQLDARSQQSVLKLAPGFRYRALLWTGEKMTDGTATPDRPDGMACFPIEDGRLCLVRNHERAAIESFEQQGLIGSQKTPRYDALSVPKKLHAMGGGTSSIVLKPKDLSIESNLASLSGTLVNCAGGPTPWGSWLSCEEVELRASEIGGKDHGYVFEVPADPKKSASAKPIKAMGLMRHEAAAVGLDGAVYLTEDNKQGSGFYRFKPNNKTPALGALEQGGELAMLRIPGQETLSQEGLKRGQRFKVDWAPIEKPDADPEFLLSPAFRQPRMMGAGRSGPFLQGLANKACGFRRLEGAWQFDGDIYFVDTTGGAAKAGVVWRYSPDKKHDCGELEVLYVSPKDAEADNIDNLTLHNQGGIILCEDGGGGKNSEGELERGTRLLALTRSGEIKVIAENNLQISKAIPEVPVNLGDYRGQEFAGACFDPSGETLFVNIQTPGVLLAIEGPWRALFS